MRDNKYDNEFVGQDEAAVAEIYDRLSKKINLQALKGQLNLAVERRDQAMNVVGEHDQGLLEDNEEIRGLRLAVSEAEENQALLDDARNNAFEGQNESDLENVNQLIQDAYNKLIAAYQPVQDNRASAAHQHNWSEVQQIRADAKERVRKIHLLAQYKTDLDEALTKLEGGELAYNPEAFKFLYNRIDLYPALKDTLRNMVTWLSNKNKEALFEDTAMELNPFGNRTHYVFDILATILKKEDVKNWKYPALYFMEVGCLAGSLPMVKFALAMGYHFPMGSAGKLEVLSATYSVEEYRYNRRITGGEENHKDVARFLLAYGVQFKLQAQDGYFKHVENIQSRFEGITKDLEEKAEAFFQSIESGGFKGKLSWCKHRIKECPAIVVYRNAEGQNALEIALKHNQTDLIAYLSHALFYLQDIVAAKQAGVVKIETPKASFEEYKAVRSSLTLSKPFEKSEVLRIKAYVKTWCKDSVADLSNGDILQVCTALNQDNVVRAGSGRFGLSSYTLGTDEEPKSWEDSVMCMLTEVRDGKIGEEENEKPKAICETSKDEEGWSELLDIYAESKVDMISTIAKELQGLIKLADQDGDDDERDVLQLGAR